MTQVITSRTGKVLKHAKSHTTTPKSNSKPKRVYSTDDQETRLQEDEAYLLNSNVKAFIDAIGDAEGGDCNLKYGGVKGKAHDKWTFTDFSTHPGVGYDGKTTAAGKYQINKETWSEMAAKVGLTDFSPHTQDILAVEILRTIGAVDAIQLGDINSALSAASRRWAALPQGKGLSGRYKQPYATYEKFSSSYEGYGGTVK